MIDSPDGLGQGESPLDGHANQEIFRAVPEA